MSEPGTFRQELDEDARLVVGVKVMAYFTNAGDFHRVRGTVTKVNRQSVRVAIDETHRGWPASHEYVIPRVRNFKVWTVNNRVKIIE